MTEARPHEAPRPLRRSGRRSAGRLARRVAVVLAALTALGTGSVAAADTGAPAVSARPAAPPPLVGRTPPAYAGALAGAWQEAVSLEQSGVLDRSAEQYETLIAARPGAADAYWRASRNYWRLGDVAAPLDRDKRLELFAASDDRASRGLEADPDCGPCVLWKYAALGRLSLIKGFVWAARHASEMAGLLDRGIALRPAHADGDANSTLANLYYASAVFYRMVPEWFWLEWVVGVRGDTDRALSDIHSALAITGDRVDYQVELGAILLCRAKRRGSEESRAQGFEALRHAIAAEPRLPGDAIDQKYARELLLEPDLGCDFSPDGYIDVEEYTRGGAGETRARR